MFKHDTIMRDRNVVEWNSFPSRYAVRVAKFDQSVGSRKELVVYPTPNGTHIINSTYVMTPAKLESGAVLPCGGTAGKPLNILFYRTRSYLRRY